MSSRCNICDKQHAPVYDREKDVFYCNTCQYWIDKARGTDDIGDGWDWLAALLENDGEEML